MDFLKSAYCVICKSDQIVRKFQILHGSDALIKKLHLISIPNVFLYQCNNCGHHFISPGISKNLLEKYYNQLNSEFYDSEQIFSYKQRKKYNWIISKVLNGKKNCRVLEIGCGSGQFLSMLKNKYDIYGVEPSPFAVQAAYKNYQLKIEHGLYRDGLYSKDYFDFVFLLDVIEHLSDPITIIKSINTILKRNGELVIFTGNIKSLNAKIAAEKWEYFNSWEHISFFSPKSIKLILTKHKFYDIKIYKTSHQGTFLSNLKIFLYSICKNLLKRIVQLSLNRKTKINYSLAFDHMLIIAKKGDR